MLRDFENQRDYARLESLIKSLAAMIVGLFGQDPSSIVGDSDVNDFGASQAEVW